MRKRKVVLTLTRSSLSSLRSTARSVSIKGAANDEAVLCTSDKTYQLRLAESSNSFLLAPNPKPVAPNPKKRKADEEPASTPTKAAEPASAEETADPQTSEAKADEESAEPKEPKPTLEVQASVAAYFELIRSAPRTGGLLALLSARPHHGSAEATPAVAETEPAEEETAADGEAPVASRQRLSMAELEQEVQCSAAELRQALQKLRAIEIEGGWCVLDPQLEMDIFECILSLCVEHEWPLTAVPTDECVRRSLDQFPAFDEGSIRHCMRTHSTQAAAAWDAWLSAPSNATIALCPEAISRFRARALLTESEVWPEDDFLAAWAENLPAGLEADPKHLAGLAVLLPPPPDTEEKPRLQSLPLSALSPVARTRFQALFGLKRNWTLEELTPYVRDLLDPEASPTKLVLLHARSVVANDGSVSYVAR